MIKNSSVYFYTSVLFSLLLLISSVMGQAVEPNAAFLSRGKLWLNTWEMMAQARAGEEWHGVGVTYPGFFGGGDIFHYASETQVGILCKKNGNDQLAWYHQKHNTSANWQVIKQNELVQNYNFVNSVNMPEEYVEGTVRTRPEFPLPGTDLGYVEITTKSMVWSLPEYDDFVIIQLKIKNVDDTTLEDFYWMWHNTWNMDGPAGRAYGRARDDEYKWYPDFGCDGAFIVYDDRTYNPDGSIPEYNLPPADQYGDIGNPGNILSANSIDKQLYAFAAGGTVIHDMTPNKFGEKKPVQNIVSYSGHPSGTPSEDRWLQELYGEGGGGQDKFDEVWSKLHYDQPRGDWDDVGTIAERNFQGFYAIGPYDLAPGDEVEATIIYVMGEMDRKLAAQGGVTAVEAYQQQALTAVEENYAAAVYLLENNFTPQAVPPPTPGNPPRIQMDDELQAEPATFEERVDGFRQGFELVFNAIPESYTDPLTGENDFKEYRIYNSIYNVHGPWELVRTLSKADAQALTSGGKVTVRMGTKANVPFRWAVTTVDNDGNESGVTAYSFYSTTAPIAPSNTMEEILVVPNPYRQVSGFPDRAEEKRLAFVNVPSKCTIRIYTFAGDLVKEIEHDGFGLETWGSVEQENYMLTEFNQNVAPGVYLFHVTNHTSGHEGEEYTGKFTIIK